MTEHRFNRPEFIYFDLGNVLLFFDHRRACWQLAEQTGVDAQRIWDVLFASGLELEYEANRLSSHELHAAFQRETQARLEFDAFALAFSDIFEVNVPMKCVLAHLANSGYRLGLLSNTNEMHWNLFSDGRYSLLPGVFEQLVLSHEVGAVKPEPAIFQAAIERAGVAPQSIFYLDDVPGHVAGACALGIDAVVFTDPVTLIAQMRQRGIELNL